MVGHGLFIVRLAVDHDPALRGLSRPPWLKDPDSLPPPGSRFF
jgi:hypothetical protein